MGDLSSLSQLAEQFTPGAYGIWTGVLMFTAWWLKEWRETRKLSAEDRLARRDGYAHQVQSLMAENRSLRDDLRKLEKQHYDYRRMCVAENDKLRRDLRITREELEEIKAALLRAGNLHKNSNVHMLIAGVKKP